MKLSLDQIQELKYFRKELKEYLAKVEKAINSTITEIGIDPYCLSPSVDYIGEYLRGEIELKELKQILLKVRN